MPHKDHNYSASEPYQAWLHARASDARTTDSVLIDLALAEKAQREGWDAPPPRLQPKEPRP